MTKRAKNKSNAEKTQDGLDFTAKVLEFGRQQGREGTFKGDCPSCGDDCCKKRKDNGRHHQGEVRGYRVSTAHQKIDADYEPTLDEGEDYSFLDPEPLTGYTLIEEMKFSLYTAKAELNRLEKLLDTYEDASRLQR